MNIITPNRLLRFARKAQWIKQSDIARKAGIAQPSLSQFENGQATLSRETLLIIAPLLSINPGYIGGEITNPFESSGLIKMFLDEALFADMDYSPIEIIAGLNTSLEVVFLVSASRYIASGRINSKKSIGQFTQVVLLRDQDGNMFLFRRKRKGASRISEAYLRNRLLEKANAEKYEITFQTKKIPLELSMRIEDWIVERSEIEDYFVQRRTRILSLEEDKLIEELRSSSYNAADLRALLRTDGLESEAKRIPQEHR